MKFKNSKYNLNVGLTAIAIPGVNVDGTGFMLNERAKYTANTLTTLMTAANTGLNGSGTIYLVMTAAANGTYIKSITIKGTASSSKGIVRIYISKGTGLQKKVMLIMEVEVPYDTAGATSQSFSKIVDFGFNLQPAALVYASTQNADLIAVTAEGLDWTY